METLGECLCHFRGEGAVKSIEKCLRRRETLNPYSIPASEVVLVDTVPVGSVDNVDAQFDRIVDGLLETIERVTVFGFCLDDGEISVTVNEERSEEHTSELQS